MLKILLLSLGLLLGIPALQASSPGHGHSPLDEGGPVLDEAGRPGYPSLLQTARETPADLEQLVLEMPIVRDILLLDPSSAEPQMSPAALQAQGREERSPRSPRRCVRLQESCLGHKLPCCDPCAACYCRFFNANCFCKKFTNTFSCGRN
ncbi:agouti-related protein [Varanus komodoensis]|uniref:agouti-related protein n=1 Tax=Varanus komodoensis TaxID=61221 RepID=UPI001CF7E17F|nr:agouti-related protein [Varanus komodoensis]